MPRKPRSKPVSLPETPVVKEELGAATVSEVATPSPLAPVTLGKLGVNQILIQKIVRVTINGREYNKVSLANGTTELLSDTDLQKQLVK